MKRADYDKEIADARAQIIELEDRVKKLVKMKDECLSQEITTVGDLIEHGGKAIISMKDPYCFGKMFILISVDPEEFTKLSSAFKAQICTYNYMDYEYQCDVRNEHISYNNFETYVDKNYNIFCYLTDDQYNEIKKLATNLEITPASFTSFMKKLS